MEEFPIRYQRLRLRVITFIEQHVRPVGSEAPTRRRRYRGYPAVSLSRLRAVDASPQANRY